MIGMLIIKDFLNDLKCQNFRNTSTLSRSKKKSKSRMKKRKAFRGGSVDTLSNKKRIRVVSLTVKFVETNRAC